MSRDHLGGRQRDRSERPRPSPRCGRDHDRPNGEQPRSDRSRSWVRAGGHCSRSSTRLRPARSSRTVWLRTSSSPPACQSAQTAPLTPSASASGGAHHSLVLLAGGSCDAMSAVAGEPAPPTLAQAVAAALSLVPPLAAALTRGPCRGLDPAVAFTEQVAARAGRIRLRVHAGIAESGAASVVAVRGCEVDTEPGVVECLDRACLRRHGCSPTRQARRGPRPHRLRDADARLIRDGGGVSAGASRRCARGGPERPARRA
jgi:hypothetical protein